jgi:hypothetical protein
VNEILTHLFAATGAAGPAVGLLIGERAKRKTAEAQTTEHVAGAIKEAVEAATSTMKTNLEQTADIARAAMAKAKECEDGRDHEKKSCEERITKSENTVSAMRSELTAMHDLIQRVAPSTLHHGIVD